MKKTNVLLTALLAFTLAGCGGSNNNTPSKQPSTGGNTSTPATSTPATSTPATSTPATSTPVESTTPVIVTYQCTIDASEDGTIVADKEAYKANEDVVLTIKPNDKVALYGIVVNGTTVYEADLTKGENGYTYTTKMVETGLSVKGIYVNESAVATINLAEYDANSLKAYAGELITIPSATAKSGDDINLTPCVRVYDETDPTAIISNNQITSDVTGKHTVKYVVEHPITKKVMNEKSVEVVFARKLLAAHDNTFSVQNEFDEDANQVVASTNGGFALSKFAFDPSETYYTEVTLNRTTDDHYAFGILNFKDGDAFNAGGLLMAIEGNDNNFKVKNFNTSGDGAWSLGDGTLDYLNYQLHNYRGVNMEQGSKEYKMSVFRTDDVFTVFINDCYVTEFEYAAYKGVPSVPGIFFWNPNTGNTCKNIVYESNVENVQTKLATLLNHGTSQVCGYAAGGATWAAGSIAKDNFRVNEYSEARGLNFDFLKDTTGHNDGMVSLYQWFDGDFTYEFDYKPTSITAGNENYMWLELRYGPWYSEGIWFGTKFGKTDDNDLSTVTVEQMTKNCIEGEKTEGWANGGVTDFSKGFHYSITRKVNGITCDWTMVVSSINDPSKSKTITYNDSTFVQRVVVLWHNKFTAGEYSNLTWKHSAE